MKTKSIQQFVIYSRKSKFTGKGESIEKGKQIREKRFALNMTQCEYADMLGVHVGNLKKWEQNRVRIFKSTWEYFFKQG